MSYKSFAKSFKTKAGTINTTISISLFTLDKDALSNTVTFESLPTLGFFLSEVKDSKKKAKIQTFVKVGKSVAYALDSSGKFMDKAEFKKDRKVVPCSANLLLSQAQFVSAADEKFAEAKKKAARENKKLAKANKAAAGEVFKPLEKLPRLDRASTEKLQSILAEYVDAGFEFHDHAEKISQALVKRGVYTQDQFDAFMTRKNAALQLNTTAEAAGKDVAAFNAGK